MIERASEFGASQRAPLVVGDSTNLSAGDMLREAREAHGLPIEVVAAALKVPTQKLQSLEDDNLDSLPDPAFARALAASVARALKIDPVKVLAKMPVSPRAALAAADRTIGSSFRSASPRSGRGSDLLLSRAFVAVIALLLIGAAALFWLPQSAFDQVSSAFASSTSRSTAERSAEIEAAPVSAIAPGTVIEPAMPAAVQPATSAVTASVGSQGAQVGAASTATAATAAVTTGTGSDILVFVARTDSWVTVTEAGGKQLLRRTVQAGETVGLSGNLPLAVVVGRASGIDVQVHGKAFDLGLVTKGGGVARFEVKS